MPLFFCSISNMTRKQYTAPQLTVVSFVIERGFAFSAGIVDPEQIENELLMLGMMEQEDYNQMETFQTYSWCDDSPNNRFFD